jgi:hypothetical protein
VPAAAVIPAPIAYAKVVAVKKLVVEPRVVGGGCGSWVESVLPRGSTPLCLLILDGHTLLRRGSVFNQVLALMFRKGLGALPLATLLL